MADYQAQIVEFKKENVDVIALSVDPLDKAKEMVEKSGAAFPIGYGLKVPEDADKVGAYWEERRGIVHATGFAIDAARVRLVTHRDVSRANCERAVAILSEVLGAGF